MTFLINNLQCELALTTLDNNREFLALGSSCIELLFFSLSIIHRIRFALVTELPAYAIEFLIEMA